MKNKLTTWTFLALLAFGYGTMKKVSFKVFNEQGKPTGYETRIPKGFLIKDVNFENERARFFLYPDSSRFYFSDNVKPSAFYPDAYKKYGKDINLKFLSADTITIEGTDDTGKLWKQHKQNNIVYGYMRVPAEKKKLFDYLVNSVLMK